MILLVFSACTSFQSFAIPTPCQNENIRKNPLLPDFNESIDFHNLREGDISEAVTYILKDADSILADILSIPDTEKTFKNTLLQLDDLYNIVSLVWSPVGLLSSVHPSEKIRDEADYGDITIHEYFIDLSINEELYQTVLAYSGTEDAASLSGGRLRFLQSELRDFKRSGFGLDKNKR